MCVCVSHCVVSVRVDVSLSAYRCSRLITSKDWRFFAFFSPNSIALQADYVTVVDDRPIMSVNIVFQFQSSTFGQN